MNTITETILRFQIQRHDELPEAHKEALRARDIDPDTRWSLVYSFNEEADANTSLEQLNDDKASWETFRVVDAGKTQHVERENWF